MLQKNRVAWPDIVKGITILLVVSHHSIIPRLREQFGYYYVHSFIVTIFMPLFFFVSGWLFELNAQKYEKNKLKAIGNKFLRLMVPYFSFSALYYILINVALSIDFFAPMFGMSNGGYEKFSLGESIFQILTWQDSMAKSLWFLYTLFIVTAINILFPKFMKHPVVVIAQFLLPFTCMFISYPDLILHVVLYTAYFSLARLAFNITDVVMNMKKYVFVIVGILYFGGAALYTYGYCTDLFVRGNTVLYCLSIVFKALIAIAGIVFFCVGSGYIGKTVYAAKFFSCIGQNSMAIYLIHAPILTQALVSFALKVLPAIPSVIDCVVAVAVSVCVSILINKFIFKKVPVLNALFMGVPLKRKKSLEKAV